MQKEREREGVTFRISVSLGENGGIENEAIILG